MTYLLDNGKFYFTPLYFGEHMTKQKKRLAQRFIWSSKKRFSAQDKKNDLVVM